MGFVSLGTVLGYPTKALPQMKSESDINVALDDYEGSMFAAIFWIAGIIFSPLGGALAGWIGRRKTILLASPLIASGWLIIAIGHSQAMLFIGRCLTGIAVCAQMSSVSVYISETVHPR